jgi:hypothetical protein
MYFPQRLNSADAPVPSSDRVVMNRCQPMRQRDSFMVLPSQTKHESCFTQAMTTRSRLVNGLACPAARTCDAAFRPGQRRSGIAAKRAASGAGGLVAFVRVGAAAATRRLGPLRRVGPLWCLEHGGDQREAV